MHLRDFKRSGHAPSLFCAFLHFDISFMVWVILGALAPFISADPALTGINLRVTPSTAVQAVKYALIIKGPDPKKHEPSNVYHLLVKNAAEATRASAKPIEKYTLDNSDPATLAALNAKSRLIQVAAAGSKNPSENVIPLASAAALATKGKGFQPV